MKKVKKKSVVPIYAGAVVWVVFSLLFPLYKLSYLLLTAGVSILAAFLASKIFKPRDVYVDEPQKHEAKPEKQPEQKPLAQRQPEHRQQTVTRKHLLLVLMPASRHMVIRRMASMSVLTWIWRRKSVTEMVGNL